MDCPQEMAPVGRSGGKLVRVVFRKTWSVPIAVVITAAAGLALWSTGSSETETADFREIGGGTSVGDLFTQREFAIADSVVVGSVIGEQPGKIFDPVAYDPADCHISRTACDAAALAEPLRQQYDAVVEVESVIAGGERRKVLIRGQRQDKSLDRGRTWTEDWTRHIYQPGTRVIVAVRDGTVRDVIALVLEIVEGKVAPRWETGLPPNALRDQFTGLSEADAIALVKKLS